MEFEGNLYEFGNSNTRDKDYIGFTLDGISSDELNIVRTSSGTRFEENLVPTIQNKIVQVPGADGTYLFGTYYTQRSHNLKIAYDSLSESNLTKLKQLMAKRAPMSLIYDESPFKQYWVKSDGQPQLQYVPFENADGRRVYKGEGTLSFVSYDPWAHGTMKYYSLKSGEEIPKWVIEYNFPTLAPDLVKNISTARTNYSFSINNVGDNPLDWKLTFPAAWLKYYNVQLFLDDVALQDNTIGMELTNKMTSLNGDITIDTKLNLITNDDKQIYNRAKIKGEYFTIPTGVHTLTIRMNADEATAQLPAGQARLDYTYTFI